MSCVRVYEEPELVSLLTLPLRWASLQLLQFDILETLMVAIIPLEDVLHTCCLFIKFALLPCKVWL